MFDAKIHTDFIFNIFDIQAAIELYRNVCSGTTVDAEAAFVLGDPNVLVVVYLQTMPLMLLSVVPLSIQTSSFFYKF